MQSCIGGWPSSQNADCLFDLEQSEYTIGANLARSITASITMGGSGKCILDSLNVTHKRYLNAMMIKQDL